MTTTPYAKNTPAEQAKALLAYAADKSRFRSPFIDSPSVLYDQDAATATYAAQAATAQALLAVVGELAALRVEVRRAATARLEELPNLASGMRDLATALKPLQDIADSVDGLTDQVEGVRDEVEDGLAVVADTMTLLFDRRRSRWWSRLGWPVRRRRYLADRSDTTVPETESRSPVDVEVAPVVTVPVIPAGQDALERLAYLREVLADWAVTLPDHPNRSGLRQGLAVTVYEAWEATHGVVAQVVGSLPAGVRVSGPVQDAVLFLAAALQEMGPAGVPSIEAVRAVSDRLTELLKVVAAEAVVARAEVDAR